MAVPAGYDIGLDSTDPADANAVRGFMVIEHRQNDITPSSARRSDGDTRFQTIPSESFWSQQDWSGGYGLIYPADPAMFWSGPADTLEAGRLRSAWKRAGGFNLGTTAVPTVMATVSGDGVYVGVQDGVNHTLYELTPSGPSTSIWDPLSAAPTSIVKYRGAAWVGYGAAANVNRYPAGSATAVAPAFKAQILCPYGSMLFYVYLDTATNTWRLNRYDPENTTAVADLAVLPVGGAGYVRSLVVVGPDLFLVCQDALYKFTSTNGNSGVLAGPLDTWTPTGSGGRNVSGYAAVVYGGALVYSTGGTLRRYQPGGAARQVWPTSPGRSSTTVGGDESGQQLQLAAFVPYDDRLYIVAADPGVGATSTATHNLHLLCWNGRGMHWLSTETVTTTTAQTIARPIAAIDSYGNLLAATPVGGTVSDGIRTIYWMAGPSSTRKYQATTTWRSSMLDFGTLDLDKVISRIGVACTVPDDATHSLSVSLYVLDRAEAVPAWTQRALATRSGSYSEVAGAYSIVYFSRSAAPLFLKGQMAYIEVTLTGPAGATTSIEVAAVTAIPNPVYPVRYGFRAVIPIGRHVVTHLGESAYPADADVATALAYLRTLRAASYPYTLDWIDGNSYTVRANTIAIVRDAMRADEDAWVVTVDFQEITG